MSLDASLAVEVPGADLAVDEQPDAVAFTLAVTNSGADPVTLQFRSGRTAAFEVAGGDDVVWRSTDDTLVTMALRTERLDPGETLTETATWDEPRSGTFTVVARLDATDVDVTAEASFEV